jgi:serine-threonine kinase receptor-associated protein
MGVWEIHFSSDGASFITAAHDKTALIRDSATGNWLHKLEGHKGAVWSAKIAPSGRLAATGSGDASARLWALEAAVGAGHSGSGAFNRSATVHEFVHKKVVRTVEFSPVRCARGLGDETRGGKREGRRTI